MMKLFPPHISQLYISVIQQHFILHLSHNALFKRKWDKLNGSIQCNQNVRCADTSFTLCVCVRVWLYHLCNFSLANWFRMKWKRHRMLKLMRIPKFNFILLYNRFTSGTANKSPCIRFSLYRPQRDSATTRTNAVCFQWFFRVSFVSHSSKKEVERVVKICLKPNCSQLIRYQYRM